MSNGEANFGIVQDDSAVDPGDARRLVRHDDRRFTSVVALDSFFTRGTLRIPDDGALVLIGNTKELKDRCTEAAATGDVSSIATVTGLPLKIHFVRMQISGFPTYQNDTLLVISSQQYWNNVGRAPAATWKELDYYRSSLSLFDDNAQNSLPRLVQSIKNDHGNPTVDKEGRPL
jgi:hypothetical protein